MEAVSDKKGCPSFVRGDRGADNGHVAKMQEILTERESFIYGRSTTNQKIEMLWDFVRNIGWMHWEPCTRKGSLMGTYLTEI